MIQHLADELCGGLPRSDHRYGVIDTRGVTVALIAGSQVRKCLHERSNLIEIYLFSESILRRSNWVLRSSKTAGPCASCCEIPIEQLNYGSNSSPAIGTIDLRFKLV